MNNKVTAFSFPLTDFTCTPATHFTDLLVTIEVQIGREIKTQIKSILYTEKGTDNSCRALPLLRVVAPELVQQIRAAAKEKALAEYRHLLKTEVI